jgi:hypothetical protein
MSLISIIKLLASLITLFAVWGRISAMYFNWNYFMKDGLRITFMPGAYIIKKGDLDGLQIYQSSDRQEDNIRYIEKGKIEHYEEKPPFFKWRVSLWSDDIRMPHYPIWLLK